jgi:hypothetical protein
MTLPHDATITHLDMASGSGFTTSPMTGPLPGVIAGAEFWAGIEDCGDDDGPG